MMSSLLLIFLYAACAAGLFAAASFLGRPLDKKTAVLFAILPLGFLWPGFAQSKTRLPIDHALAVPPWAYLPHPPRYNVNSNDLALQIAPWQKAVRLAWKEGSLPLRDRWNGCGMPLAANGQSAAFSPFTLLSLPLPLARGFTLTAAVILLAALAGMWLWLTELKISSDAAVFGAIAFAFSFSLAPWLEFPIAAVVGLWPLVLFLVERLREEGSARRAGLGLAAVLAAGMLCGHQESLILIAAFAGVWLLGRRVTDNSFPLLRVIRLAASAAFLAVAVTAFALIPQAFAILASSRFASVQVPFGYSFASLAPHVPKWREALFTTFLPRAFGDGIHSPVLSSAHANFYEMALGHIGIIGWAAALLILRPGGKRKGAELALLPPIVLALTAATGMWPIHEIKVQIPLLKMIFPFRLLSWLALAGAGLAAFELDRLKSDAEANRRADLWPIAPAAALGLFALWAYQKFRPLHAKTGGLISQRHALALALMAVGLLALLALLWTALRLPPRHLALPLALLLFGELSWQAGRLSPFFSIAELYPETPLLQFLRGKAGNVRVLGEVGTIFPNSNVFAGVEEIRTHDPVERRDYFEFLHAAFGIEERLGYFKFLKDANAPALDFLNVGYLVSLRGRKAPAPKWKPVYSGWDGTVFENADVLPRIFAPPHVRRVAWPASRFAVTQNVFGAFKTTGKWVVEGRRWATEAIVSFDEPGASFQAEDDANDRIKVDGFKETTNSVSFHVSPTRPGPQGAVLVTSFSTDGGWEARDETGKLPTGVANGPFLAILVPPGGHDVTLIYRPPGFRVGCAITGAALLLSLGIVVLSKRRPA
jgi:hypothetical protein